MRVPDSRPLVSAVFASASAAEEALVALEASGIPRDLIEIAVSERGAREHYQGRTRRNLGRDAVRYAGIGGLLGLVLGAGAALVLLSLLGRAELCSANAVAYVRRSIPDVARGIRASTKRRVGFEE